MIVKPKIRGFICTTAHPDGCAAAVNEQIEYIKSQGKIDGPKKVLVIGASTGFGLSTRLTAAFGAGADTIGVFFERPAEGSRTASAGWYQSIAMEKAAKKEGLYAKSFNGDAFSHAVKKDVIDTIKKDLGQVDLIVYSLASPVRTHPDTGEALKSVLKPIGESVVQKSINVNTGVVSEITIDPASDDEIRQTVAVMGGEDWQMWIQALKDADALSEKAITIAYSYIGPEVTKPVYYNGTIGTAKKDLAAKAKDINKIMEEVNGNAFVSVNKALVTQASSAIPVMPLYINILYKVMKEHGTHEGCKEQIYRLFKERLYTGSDIPTDQEGRIRIDDLELAPDVQKEVTEIFNTITTENQADMADLSIYNEEFIKLFGFGYDGIDYDLDIEVNRNFE